ncbi:hypothetical protein IWW38_005472, partial [Coemansia aciculifera]
GNSHLKLGLMVGVFDVPLTSAGSGPNNINLFQAHTGVWVDDADTNPFDAAFNLTIEDVQELVCKHMDNNAKADDDDATKKQLRADLMLYCFRMFDGYHYGAKQHIFSTYCVVIFLCSVNSRCLILQLPDTETNFWTNTGVMAMFQSMGTADADIFVEYAAALAREFTMRHGCYYGNRLAPGVLLQRLQMMNLDADMVGLCDIPGNEHLNDVDAAVLEKVAYTCTQDLGNDDALDWSANERPVSSVMRQLYQAGYLTQLSRERVGIPNPEVFHAFTDLADKTFKKSTLQGTFKDTTLLRLGIGDGNIILFTNYLDEVMSQQLSAITGKTK